jgi:hypothetical protein
MATTLSVMGALPAGADYAPQPGDVVGVGGDTPQYALTFLANGDTNGDLGFNSSGAYNRLVTFNATADANGRSSYAQGSTEASPKPLDPTDALRAGTYPVQRVSSSGTAIKALLADTSTPEKVNFIFSASLPSVTQQSKAASNGWGYLHVVEIATDAVKIAADSTSTNAPAGLSTADLLGIYNGTYTKWTQIPGNSGGSSATIVPEIPPSGSSIYKTFVASLTAANGGSTVTLGGDVQTVEQNDPTAITGSSSSANAIVPFSAGRLNLYNSGYFHTPATPFPGSSTALSAGINLLTGAVPGGGTAYSAPITDYVIFRQSDSTSSAPFEPGSSLNWVQTLFVDTSGPKPFVDTEIGKALIDASGVTSNYDNLGNVT